MRVWTPSTTTSRPSTSTCCTSRAEPANTTESSACSGSQPASPHRFERDGHQVRPRARLEPPGVRPPEAGVPALRGRPDQRRGRVVPAFAARKALVELDRPSLFEHVDHGVGVTAERERGAGVHERAHPADAVGQVALRRRDRRSARARAAEQGHVAVVEVGGVNGGEARVERAGVGEQRGRGAPVRRQTGLVLGGLLRDMRVQRPVLLAEPTPRQPPPPLGRPRACCGSPRRSAPIRSRRVHPRVPPTPPRCRPRSAAAPPPAPRRSRRAGSSSRSA